MQGTEIKTMYRLRGMCANHAMVAILDKTRKLVDTFGIDGANDYLKWQLYLIDGIRDERQENVGDDEDVL